MSDYYVKSLNKKTNKRAALKKKIQRIHNSPIFTKHRHNMQEMFRYILCRKLESLYPPRSLSDRRVQKPLKQNIKMKEGNSRKKVVKLTLGTKNQFHGNQIT